MIWHCPCSLLGAGKAGVLRIFFFIFSWKKYPLDSDSMCVWQTLWTSKRQLDDKIPIWNTHTRLVCASLMIQIHGNFNLNSHQPSVHWWWGASQPHRGRVCGLRRIFTTNQHMLHTYIFYLTTFCTHKKLQSNTFSNLVCFSFERNFVCSLTIFISVPRQI